VSDYAFGTVKQNPDTKVAAIRSAHPQDSPMAWLVANPNLPPAGGGHWASTKEIESVDWVDMTPIVDVS